MGIVVITIPGEAQRTFVNSLHTKTSGGVDLVIIHKSRLKHRSLFGRLKDFYTTAGFRNLATELYYAILLRFKARTRETLDYFRERSDPPYPKPGYLSKTLEVDSINSDEVFETLQSISPDLLVIWGNTIIKPYIINTARRTINLHMGLCPYYQGAVANQHAVISRDLKRIGATIHYAVNKVDAGDIIETIRADGSKSPRELFRDLNDKAEKRYLEIAKKLYQGEKLPQRKQDTSRSQKFLLKNWTRETRYKLARQIQEWEKTGVFK